jgi:hypothetical protein
MFKKLFHKFFPSKTICWNCGKMAYEKLTTSEVDFRKKTLHISYKHFFCKHCKFAFLTHEQMVNKTRLTLLKYWKTQGELQPLDVSKLNKP